ncbi:hypothetical protein [Haladaptatus sp. NG-SE-30]
MSFALKPLIRLAITFALVWFYLGLTSGFLDGWVQVLVTVTLAIPTWLVISRALFPADDSETPWNEDTKR